MPDPISRTDEMIAALTDEVKGLRGDVQSLAQALAPPKPKAPVKKAKPIDGR